ncbi:MAG TPA: carboxymuconolactone decarboxylase family protein [Actinomycetes bacterium]
MAHLSYVDPSSLTDPDLVDIMEFARQNGTPRPESQAIRAHVPDLLRTFTAAWRTAFLNGVLDHRIKELCRLYVSRTVDCRYCGDQRSVKAAGEGVDERHVDELLNYQTSGRFNERERTALAYTEAITWNPDLADDAMWAKLHEHFTEPEIVELGYFVALTSGQQRWIRTLGIGHKELLADTDVGLAPQVVSR